MKRVLGTELLIVLLVIGIGGGLGYARHLLSGSPSEENAVTTHFRVEGMDCENCENGIAKKVGELAGVIGVEVSHTEGSASVIHDPGMVSSETIVEEITGLGFPARLAEIAPAAPNS